MDEIIQMLSRLVPCGTMLHALSERPVQAREYALKGLECPNIHIEHHVGERTSLLELQSLPLHEAFAILVLSETTQNGNQLIRFRGDASANEDAITSDSACLATMQVVAGILEGRYDNASRRAVRGRCVAKPRIICEVLDPRTDRVLARNKMLREKAIFFRSCALETGLFNIAASNPTSFNAIVRLLSQTVESSAGLTLAPITDFITDETEFVEPGEIQQCISSTLNKSKHFDIKRMIDPTKVMTTIAHRMGGKDVVENGGFEQGLSVGELCERVRQQNGGILVGFLQDNCSSDASMQVALVSSVDHNEKLAWRKDEVLVVLLREEERKLAAFGELSMPTKKLVGEDDDDSDQSSAKMVDYFEGLPNSCE